MIKNIVFDLGGVLVDFNPKIYLEKLGLNKQEIELFTKMIYWGEEWYEYNASKITAEETKEKLMKRYPDYADKIEFIFDNIDYQYILFEKKDTAEYLIELKKRGYHIYILSDLSVDSYEYNKQFEFFKFIDGGVYSFEVGSTKPNAKNYEVLLNEYHLVPKETIFIDDKQENIEAAEKFYINGIVFTDLENVKNKIIEIINK